MPKIETWQEYAHATVESYERRLKTVTAQRDLAAEALRHVRKRLEKVYSSIRPEFGDMSDESLFDDGEEARFRQLLGVTDSLMTLDDALNKLEGRGG